MVGLPRQEVGRRSAKTRKNLSWSAQRPLFATQQLPAKSEYDKIL